MNFTFCLSLSYDGELSVGTHLDDAAWLMLFFALAVVFDNIINCILDFVANRVECLRSRFAADVCAGADNRLLETETKFFAEFLAGNAYSGTSVFSNEVGG